jgi:hypothetical protein
VVLCFTTARRSVLDIIASHSVDTGIIKKKDLARNKKKKENCRKVEDIGDFSSIDPSSVSIVFHFM